jgi:hypothetical protein
MDQEIGFGLAGSRGFAGGLCNISNGGFVPR